MARAAEEAGEDGRAVVWGEVPLVAGSSADEARVGRRRVLEALWRDALGDPSVLLALERPLRSFCEGLRGRRLSIVQSLTDEAGDALEGADWEPLLVQTLCDPLVGLSESTGWGYWDRIEARLTGRQELRARAVQVSPDAEENLCALHASFAPLGLGAAFAREVGAATTGYAGAEFVFGGRTGIRRCRVSGFPVLLYSRGGSWMRRLVAVRASFALPTIGPQPTPERVAQRG